VRKEKGSDPSKEKNFVDGKGGEGRDPQEAENLHCCPKRKAPLVQTEDGLMTIITESPRKEKKGEVIWKKEKRDIPSTIE